MSIPLPATVEPSTVPDAARAGLGIPHPRSRPSAPVPLRPFLKLRDIWSRLPPKAKLGAALLGFFVLLALIGPTLAPFDPNLQNPLPNVSLHAPDSNYVLGTTNLGQDVFSQLMSGIRLTLILGVVVGLAATTLSAVIGITAAYLGGVWDEALSLLTNVVLVLPALPLLIILLGYLPQKGQTPTIIVLSALSWPWGARVIRAQTLALRNRDFIAAANETGERAWRIIIFDIIPNEISLIAASFVNTVLYAIGASVALAFIGVADLSSWSLGTMLYWANSQSAFTQGAWWWYVFPGLAVALMGMGLVLLNFGIDEIGNPRLRNVSASKKLGLGTWSPSRPTLVLRSTQAGMGPRPGLGSLPANGASQIVGSGGGNGKGPGPEATGNGHRRSGSERGR